MSLKTRLKKQSTWTALGACLFIGGVVLLFILLYYDTARVRPLPWIAGAFFIGTIICWIASARTGDA